MDNISKFYLDSTYVKEQIGFTYSDVRQFSNEELESCHNYIQWAFPTEEPSRYNRNAPYPSSTTFSEFEEYPILKNRMSLLLHRMILFYFNDVDGYTWVTPRNHNFLRITRILKCLKLFKMPEEHKIFVDYINQFLLVDAERVNIIGPETLKFWSKAMNYENRSD